MSGEPAFRKAPHLAYNAPGVFTGVTPAAG
jgi:hypothetical protein